MMTLVNIRCHRCRNVLHAIEARPASWDGAVNIRRCRRCDFPDPGRIAAVLTSKGLDGMGIAATMPWSMLRAAIERAEKTGKVQSFAVRVSDDPAP